MFVICKKKVDSVTFYIHDCLLFDSALSAEGMRNQVKLMPSLEVMLERLPEAVIAGLEGPIVKQDFASLQSLPALDMATVAMLLRRKVPIHSTMPLLEVVLERLPEPLMTALVSRRNGRTVMLSDIIKSPKTLTSLKTTAIAKMFASKKAMPSLGVTVERLPQDLMTTLLSQRKVLPRETKGKKGLVDPKDTGYCQACSTYLQLIEVAFIFRCFGIIVQRVYNHYNSFDLYFEYSIYINDK